MSDRPGDLRQLATHPRGEVDTIRGWRCACLNKLADRVADAALEAVERAHAEAVQRIASALREAA